MLSKEPRNKNENEKFLNMFDLCFENCYQPIIFSQFLVQRRTEALKTTNNMMYNTAIQPMTSNYKINENSQKLKTMQNCAVVQNLTPMMYNIITDAIIKISKARSASECKYKR